jgi:hypothetical protein
VYHLPGFSELPAEMLNAALQFLAFTKKQFTPPTKPSLVQARMVRVPCSHSSCRVLAVALSLNDRVSVPITAERYAVALLKPCSQVVECTALLGGDWDSTSSSRWDRSAKSCR